MSISSIGNENSCIYDGYTDRLSAKDGSEEEFIDCLNDDQEEKTDEKYGRVPKRFAGMSFKDLINSGAGRKIPTVNQIVSARSPEDGKIYRAFFTDRNITCHDADGRTVWEIDIQDTQHAQKVKDYFEMYQPNRDWFREYCSGDKMGMAVVKSFWMNLFERN